MGAACELRLELRGMTKGIEKPSKYLHKMLIEAKVRQQWKRPDMH